MARRPVGRHLAPRPSPRTAGQVAPTPQQPGGISSVVPTSVIISRTSSSRQDPRVGTSLRYHYAAPQRPGQPLDRGSRPVAGEAVAAEGAGGRHEGVRAPPTARSGRSRATGTGRCGGGTRWPPCGRTPGRSRGPTARTGAAPACARCGPGASARSGPPDRTRSRSRRTTPAAWRRRRTARCGSRRPGCRRSGPAATTGRGRRRDGPRTSTCRTWRCTAGAARGSPARRQAVGVGALAHEVVARLARRPGAHPRHPLLVERQRRVEEHHAIDPVRVAEGEVLHHRPAEVAADQHDPVEAELVVDEGVHVADVGGDVVEAVGTDVAVAEAAQVGHDDVEAGRRQWLDHPPEDPLRLGPAVDADERHAARALAHVRLPEPAPDRRSAP